MYVIEFFSVFFWIRDRVLSVRVVRESILIGTTTPVKVEALARRAKCITVMRMFLDVFYERAFEIPQRIAGCANPAVHGDAAPVITSISTYQFGSASGTTRHT